MSGSEGPDIPGLLPELKEILEEVEARGPVELPPPRDRDEVYRWIAICDPEVTGVGLPPHYPDINHLIRGSLPVEICGRLVPAPDDSRCGGHMLEIDERLALDARPRDDCDVAHQLTKAEHRAMIVKARERVTSGEVQREMHEARKNAVPGIAFRTKKAEALKILDRWFGVGSEEGSPYERRLAMLGSPGMYAWVWCKAMSRPHPNVGSALVGP